MTITPAIGLLTVLVIAAVVGLLLVLRKRAGKPTEANHVTKIIEYPSPNFDDRRGQKVTFLILHYTAMNTAQEALDKLTDSKSEGKVSAHYLVAEDGKTYRLVAEDKRAWHAGISFWDGYRDINSKSIGIEIANPGDVPFPSAQMDAVIELCQGILKRHRIPVMHIIGHSDVAPSRKPDPGPLFDWPRLASLGIGVWPTPNAEDYVKSAKWTDSDVKEGLTEYGYNPDEDTAIAIGAFQRHFHQELFKTNPQAVGKTNAETAARLACLLRRKATAASEWQE
jgi:N-acetylmuramoyl-L-alanine amidase